MLSTDIGEAVVHSEFCRVELVVGLLSCLGKTHADHRVLGNALVFLEHCKPFKDANLSKLVMCPLPRLDHALPHGKGLHAC